jgi:hypothetical protein
VESRTYPTPAQLRVCSCVCLRSHARLVQGSFCTRLRNSTRWTSCSAFATISRKAWHLSQASKPPSNGSSACVYRLDQLLQQALRWSVLLGLACVLHFQVIALFRTHGRTKPRQRQQPYNHQHIQLCSVTPCHRQYLLSTLEIPWSEPCVRVVHFSDRRTRGRMVWSMHLFQLKPRSQRRRRRRSLNGCSHVRHHVFSSNVVE